MSGRVQRAAEFVRANAVGVGAALLLVAGAVAAARFIASSRSAAPPPRRVMQFTMVNVQPLPAVKPPPPPPPVQQPREEEQTQTTRVNLKPNDFQQPDLSRPAPGGGRLSLAAEGEGAGDAFNLTGNPGGKGLLSGGGLGDGTGEGTGLGDGNGTGNRYGWYYARIAGEIEAAFRKNKALNAAAARVELRVWADRDGRVSRVELIHSTGDARLDDAIQSVVGMRLSEPPPGDIPMPMIARLTARRVMQ